MPRSDFGARKRATKVFEASGLTHEGARDIAEEVPISFLFGGVPYAVMMASPGDVEDFAYGFALTEGLIDHADEIRELKISAQGHGVAVDMRLAPEKMRGHLARRRVIEWRSSCGLCGVESADMLPQAPRVTKAALIEANAVFMALRHLSANQPLNAATRAVHAAGLWLGQDDLLVREDVGRHNALDKIIGAAAAAVTSASDGVVLLTSRVSVELVQKTARLGAPIIAAISAPTALAVRVADKAGITLAAVLRGEDFEIFTRPERITGEARRHEV